MKKTVYVKPESFVDSETKKAVMDLSMLVRDKRDQSPGGSAARKHYRCISKKLDQCMRMMGEDGHE